MFRLTREVRFAVNSSPDTQLENKPTNSHGGYPSLTGLGVYLTARVTLAGDLDPASSYLENIKQIDAVVREHLPALNEKIRAGDSAVRAVALLKSVCAERWSERFESVSMSLSPFLEVSAHRAEVPMIRLSQKFEFSASHRLSNPKFTDEQNRATFGKCSNPNGHGHNYELKVTLAGEPDRVDGILAEMPAFERVVAEAVVDRFDHKNLNVDVPEFRELNPSVENITRVIYKLLEPKFCETGVKLASVTVWETPKTWCEYSE